jgi:hypothetical protein
MNLGDHTVMKAPKTGGASMIIGTAEKGAGGIAVSGSHVYWTTRVFMGEVRPKD